MIHQFDAKKEVLGRMATQIARVLTGRNKINYTPNILDKDCVVVINSNELLVTGNKKDKKMYHHYSGYPGGVKTLSLKQQIERDSREVIRAAVYGMLPKNKLRDQMIKRLFIYKDEKHDKKIDIIH